MRGRIWMAENGRRAIKKVMWVEKVWGQAPIGSELAHDKGVA